MRSTRSNPSTAGRAGADPAARGNPPTSIPCPGPANDTGASRRRRNRAVGQLAAALVAAAVLVAACSSGSKNAAGNPSTGPSSGNPSASQSPSGPAYAECMRAHGVTNFPDPTGSGGFQITKDITSNPHFKSASTACQSLRPQGNGGSGGGNDQKALALAQCMRANGVPNFPDPTNGRVQLGPELDPQSPTFQKAFKLCQAKTGAGTGAPVQGGGGQ